MPLYKHRCFDCGDEFEEFRSMKEDSPTICKKCGGGDLRQILSAPSLVVEDIKPYKSVVTGEMITSRSKHREHLKRNNLVEVGDQLPPSLKKYREEQHGNS